MHNLTKQIPDPRNFYYFCCVFLIISVFFILIFPSSLFAARASFTWDASNSSHVEGYKIHYGQNSSNYNNTVDVGNQTNCTLTGFDLDSTYYFAVTAYEGDMESSYSNQISYDFPDEDSDGLATNEESNYYGTNATKADTDSDGLNDGEEVSYWKNKSGTSWDEDLDGDGKINLLDGDADGDGISDGNEIDQGSDPADAFPVADTGSEQRVNEGTTVVLNATNSSDPDGEIADYNWTQTNGTEVELSDKNSSTPKFIAPQIHRDMVTLTFELTVTDNSGQRNNSTTQVYVNNVETDSDNDGLTDSEEIVIYNTDPSNSDTDGDGITDGEEVNFWGDDWNKDIDGDGKINVLDPDADGDGVEDGTELSEGTNPGDSTSYNEEVASEPVAQAGPDRTFAPDESATLNGLNSYATDFSIVSYEWKQISGPEVSISDADKAKTSFITPDTGDSALEFQLKVTDENGNTATDTCIINVSNNNKAPQAEVNKVGTVLPGDIVTLDASNSRDADGSIASYTWTQIKGYPLEINNVDSAKPQFSVPYILTNSTSLVFQLIVTDDKGLKDSETCIVRVSDYDEAPNAKASSDNSIVNEGSTVHLDASASTDDSEIKSYHWEQVAGPTIILSKANTANPSFVAPNVDDDTNIEFRLQVTDDAGLVSTDTVEMTVKDKGLSIRQDIDDDSIVLYDDKLRKNTAIEAGKESSLVAVNLEDPDDLQTMQTQETDSAIGPEFKGQVFDFAIKVGTPGDTATVNIYYDKPIPEDYIWCKYDSFSGWSEFISNAEFSQDRKKVTLTLVDGGAGDQDGKENGVIVDPSGPALTTELNDDSQDSVNDTDGTGGGCTFTPDSNSGWGWSLLLLLPLMIAVKRLVGISMVQNKINY